MTLSRIAGFFLSVFCCSLTACGTSAADLEHVWNDLTAMQLVVLPRLADYDHQSRWVPDVQCSGGRAAVHTEVQHVQRRAALGQAVHAEQDGIHDIELKDCRPSTLVYSGSVQRELQLVRAEVSTDNRTVDWLHGGLQLHGAWEDTCQVNLRGIQRGGQIVYRGRLCDEQVEHIVTVP